MFANGVCEIGGVALGEEFARVVLAAFREAGITSDTDVARAKGPSTSTMTKLRKAASGEADLARPRQPTMDAIDRTARWEPGSAAKVWDGGKPELAPEPTPPLPAGVKPIGDPSEGLVEFRVSGAFGVQAVVRGPITDIDALQAAVSRLIAGMRVDDVDENNVT